jgi:hypothetical protein
VGRAEARGQSQRHAETGGLPAPAAGAPHIEDAAHKIVKLLVADPAKVVYAGNGEVSLGCGVQKARRITVEYFPKANARLATAGEVATIEFQ